MKDLIITLGLGSKQIKESRLEDFERMNIGPLLSIAMSEGTALLDINYIELVKNYLHENQIDVILGHTINNLEEYIELKEALQASGTHRITEAFFRRGDSVEEYRELYKKHSNWLDNSVEFAQLKQDEFNAELDRIANVLRADRVKVNFVR